MYEVWIEMLDGKTAAIMLKTRDKGEAESYADDLRSRPKWARNLVKVVSLVNEGRHV